MKYITFIIHLVLVPPFAWFWLLIYKFAGKYLGIDTTDALTFTNWMLCCIFVFSVFYAAMRIDDPDKWLLKD